MILAYIITNSTEEAEKIGLDILEKKLALTINILPEIKSMRREGGKIVSQGKTLVMIETKASLYKKIEARVLELQTSNSTTIFSVPITQMSEKLFANIQANTQPVETLN